MPKWFSINSAFAQYFTKNIVDQFDYSAVEAGIDAQHVNGTGQTASEQQEITDDCLFLDVIVPHAVLNKSNTSSLAPVMIWIHGGAYVTGNKIDSSAGDPSGLISASQKNGSEGFIYVSMNYRLGGLGFMSGELFESQGGIPNLGLRS
ncbi:hypothetical protein INS49_004163 [Diaporthe citri]|uniref:uncharacterized protein n=1 Tax=Diaporthe citri TaxID=83186 RepID=UPI001C818FD2|nr:uncharacterized protein INS49_004163 [Diaporthe citri]KAG6355082.1 hypothetical protein INS49_004163 [Diaporthe citri]